MRKDPYKMDEKQYRQMLTNMNDDELREYEIQGLEIVNMIHDEIFRRFKERNKDGIESGLDFYGDDNLFSDMDDNNNEDVSQYQEKAYCH